MNNLYQYKIPKMRCIPDIEQTKKLLRLKNDQFNAPDHRSQLEFRYIWFSTAKQCLWWKRIVHRKTTVLTHWGRDIMDAIFQTTLSNGFSWMKMYEFRLTFHWSLFLGVQSTFQNGINVTQTCFVATTSGTLLLHKYSSDTFRWP